LNEQSRYFICVHLIYRRHTIIIVLAKIFSENKVIYHCFPRSEIKTWRILDGFELGSLAKNRCVTLYVTIATKLWREGTTWKMDSVSKKII